MRKITILLITAFMAFALFGKAQVFITELADPNNAAGARFVELYNAGAVAVDLSTGYDLQRWTNNNATPQSAVELTGSIPAGGFYTVCANQTTFTSTYGFAADQNMGGGGPADGNGDDQLALRDPSDAIIDMFGVPGEDGSGTNHEFEDGRAERKATVTTGNSTYTFAEWNIWNDTGAAGTTNDPQDAPDDFDPGSWIGAVAGPAISVSPNSLTGFSYVFAAGPSSSQSFTVEGGDLTTDIIVTPSTNYEISFDDITFQSTFITLTQSGGSVSTSTLYTRLKAGLAAGDYNEDITCSSTGATDKTVSCSGTVEAPATTTLPYSETFDADLGDCYTYSVSGATKEWEWGTGGTAYINGHNSGDTEEDWLILPGINMDNYTDVIMTFDNWYKYGNGDDATHYLKLYYSTNYSGIGDPSSPTTWTELSFNKPSGWEIWTNSLLVDLTGVTGSSVYIAFEYYYESDSYRTWQIDNISIFEGTLVNTTFQVNMTDETVSANGVHVAGNFNGWNPSATAMTDGNTDDIYDVTLPLYSDVEYQFKYINDNDWPGAETVPSECQSPGTTNRYEVIGGADYSIPPVCFSSCADCGTLFDYDITFQVDMQNETVTGDVYLAGDFNGWSDQVMTNTGGTVYELTLILTETNYYEYKFKNGPGGWENSISNRQLTVPSANTILDLVCFDSYDACPVSDFVMINEVDVDQASTDTEEFIELYDGGVGNTNLSGLIVVLYNGSDDQSYLPPVGDPSLDLDGYFTNGSGYFVIGSATVPNVDLVMSNGFLQNGPDAVALYEGNDSDFPNDTPVTTTNLLDAIVYDTNDDDDSGLLVLLNPGEPQVNEGGRGNQTAHSSQRLPNGSGGQRNTSTYDQAIPTPGVVNAASFTDWTGLVDNNWDDAGNWTTGIPVVTLGATIPNLAPIFPVISGSAACLNLFIEGGSSLEIAPIGDLTVIGELKNFGGILTVRSDDTGDGSLIEGTYNGGDINVERYLTADRYHGFSPSVGGEVIDIFHLAGGQPDVYLYENNEATFDYTELYTMGTGLNAFQGYMVYVDGANAGGGSVSDWTFTETGSLNSGTFGATDNLTMSTGLAIQRGWNLLGNPYTSTLDWQSAYIASGGGTTANVDATVYVYNGTPPTGGWATWNANTSIGTNDGSQYIAMGQSFFVKVSSVGSGTFMTANTDRVHNDVGFLKSEISNRVALQVEGNGFTDETAIVFIDDATVGFDSDFDAYKLMSDHPGVPSLYSVANTNLAVNALPETNWVQLGFSVTVNGEYTISAVEINDIGNVVLEDTFTGEMTDLNVSSYTFTASTGDAADRFIVHFTPLGLGDNMNEVTNIYSYHKSIYVNVPENTQGYVTVYDMMGKEVANAAINNTLNTITLEKSAYYVVKVVSNENMITEKVFIK